MRDWNRHALRPRRRMALHGLVCKFTQRPLTLAAPMTTGTNRVALPVIIMPAVRASPGVFRQRMNGLIQGMADRNAEPIPIHDGHQPMKLRPVVRPPLQNIVLPLMNHFMRQRADEFILRLTLEQWNRQSNQPPLSAFSRTGHSRPHMTHKHAH